MKKIHENPHIQAYRDMKPEQKHIPVMERKWKCSKKPWYYLTKVESIAINSRHKSAKMTHDDYIEGYLKDKMKKWEVMHKKPEESDLFYKEECPKWEAARFEFAALLSQKTAKKESNACKQNMCKYCFEYNKCNDKFMSILGYTLDEHGNSSLKKAA